MAVTRLGPAWFRTKGAAIAHVRAILHTAPLDTVLPETLTPVLLGLVQRHPLASEKLAHGCRGFVVRINPPAFKPQDRGFWIVTERGPPELVSFSYRRCFDGRDSTLEERLTGAARAAIMPSQRDFKNAQLLFQQPLCPGGCGRPLTEDNTDVDHVVPTFRAILDSFIAHYGLPPAEALEHRPTYGWRFVSLHDEWVFRAFHDGMVKERRLLCKNCHKNWGKRS